MTFVKKYCFTCGSKYVVDEAHPHVCVTQEETKQLREIRAIIREELDNARPCPCWNEGFFWPSKQCRTHGPPWGPEDPIRRACDGDIGWSDGQ